MTVRRRVLASGRVQGVFFREECRERAEEVGVAGWVRNLPDGRLEAHFEGDETEVDRLVTWCRQGPPAARVDDIEVEDRPPEGDTGFSVR